MSPIRKKESEINFIDIIFVCLKKIWIMIIVGAILGGALFSYNFLQVVKTSDTLDITKKLNSGETDVQYEMRVQRIERARTYANLIESTNDLIDYQEEYISNSIYMQIDPENVYQSTAQIALTMENVDKNGIDQTLFAAYEREIKYGGMWDEFAECIGTKPDYIRELIAFNANVSDNSIISIDNNMDKTGSFFISVFGPSREFVDECMTQIIDRVNIVCFDLNSTVTPHSISLVGVQQIVKIDNSIREGQINHTNKIQSLQGQIATYYEALDVLAKDLDLSGKEVLLNYFAKHAVVDVDGIPTEVSEKEVNRKTLIKPNLKWIGIGFAIGAFFVVFFIVLLYVFGQRVSTQAQFFGVYTSIKRIGVMKPIYKRSKFSAFVDVKAEDDTKQSKENLNKLISANYSNITKDCNKVLITGTGDKKAMDEAVRTLALKGDFKPDIFNDPDVLKTVPDYDGIVLLEQRKVSLYKNVTNEINLLSNSGTEIIGAIII